jgi:hypothetical protein
LRGTPHTRTHARTHTRHTTAACALCPTQTPMHAAGNKQPRSILHRVPCVSSPCQAIAVLQGVPCERCGVCRHMRASTSACMLLLLLLLSAAAAMAAVGAAAGLLGCCCMRGAVRCPCWRGCRGGNRERLTGGGCRHHRPAAAAARAAAPAGCCCYWWRDVACAGVPGQLCGGQQARMHGCGARGSVRRRPREGARDSLPVLVCNVRGHCNQSQHYCG